MNWTGKDPYSSEQWLEEHLQYGTEWISDSVFFIPFASGSAPCAAWIV
jgi:hypothetical protein